MKWLKENWLILFLILVVGGLAVAISLGIHENRLKKEENNRYSYQIQCLREAELKYWENKSKLVTEVQNYIDKVAPTSNLRALDLLDQCNEYRVDVIFVLAQGEIESHFGTRGIASKINSVWNVGIYDDMTVKTVRKKDIHKHPNESIVPYLELLTKDYLIGKDEYDLMKEYVNSNNDRYASDPDYEKKLSKKYEEIFNNTKIDSLQLVFKHYAIKCNKL